MFSLAHMLKFLADKFSRLRRRSFAFLRIAMGAFNYFPFRHDEKISFVFYRQMAIEGSASAGPQSSREATASNAFWPVRKSFVTLSSPLSRTSCT